MLWMTALKGIVLVVSGKVESAIARLVGAAKPNPASQRYRPDATHGDLLCTVCIYTKLGNDTQLG